MKKIIKIMRVVNKISEWENVSGKVCTYTYILHYLVIICLLSGKVQNQYTYLIKKIEKIITNNI